MASPGSTRSVDRSAGDEVIDPLDKLISHASENDDFCGSENLFGVIGRNDEAPGPGSCAKSLRFRTRLPETRGLGVRQTPPLQEGVAAV